MKPAIYTDYFADLSLEEAVQRFAANGWTRFELGTNHGAALFNDASDPAKEGERIGRIAQDHGTQFVQGHLWILADVAGADATQHRDIILRWLDAFMAIGIPRAITHPGGWPDSFRQGRTPHARQATIEALAAYAEHLRGSSTVICLENMPHGFTDAEHLIDMIDAAGAGPNLALCLDTGHANMNGQKPPAFAQAAGSRLHALHIADNDGHGDQHLLPYSRGNVDWPATLAALRSIGFDGPFNFEVPGEANAPLSAREAKLQYMHRLTEILLEG